MRNKIAHIILLLLTAPLFAFSQTPEEIIEKGNQQYINGEFEAAIESYKTVVDSGYESAILYYNVGNAYYKSNRVTESILYYEKAKLLAPNDDEINYNLELARTFVIDKIDEIPEFFLITWVKSFIEFFSVDQWGYISIFCFIIALILGLFYLFSQKYSLKKLSFIFAIIFLVISISSFSFASTQKKQTIENTTAIVFAPTVTLKSSPDISGTDLFVLHEGTKVTVVDQVGEWREIELSNGNKGWLNIGDIRMI